MEKHSVSALLNFGATALSSLEQPRLETTILLCFALGKTKEKLLASLNEIVSEIEANNFFSLIKRRQNGEPTAYILGKKEFFGLQFIVNPNVLIPRPDTEVLVEKAIELIETRIEKILYGDKLVLKNNEKQTDLASSKKREKITIVDCCTGSGAIIISVAKTLLEKYSSKIDFKFIATDISTSALEVAKINIEQNNLNEKIELLCGDLLEPIPASTKIDFLLTNPPYLTNLECDEKKEQNWAEPDLALRGGDDGLDLVKKIILSCKKYFVSGSVILIEASFNQHSAICDFLKRNNFSDVEVIKDLASLDRVSCGTFCSN